MRIEGYGCETNLELNVFQSQFHSLLHQLLLELLCGELACLGELVGKRLGRLSLLAEQGLELLHPLVATVNVGQLLLYAVLHLKELVHRLHIVLALERVDVVQPVFDAL